MESKITYIFWMFFFILPLFGQTHLNGIVTYANSQNQPAKGIEISTFGANSTFTLGNGVFKLEYKNRQPGDKVKLMVGDKDENGDNITVANVQILDLFLPSSPDEHPIKIYICYPEERKEVILKIYGILEKDIFKTFSDRREQLTAQLEQSNQDNSVLIA